MHPGRADLVYEQNNGVIAVMPTDNGRLAGLVKKTNAGDDRVWVFRDTHIWHDDDGDERIDHHARGVVCGTFAEGRAFLNTCNGLGLSFRCGLFVPFSNGQHRYGRFSDGEPANDWSEDELKLMRWDLPTEEQLKALLERAKAVAEAIA